MSPETPVRIIVETTCECGEVFRSEINPYSPGRAIMTVESLLQAHKSALISAGWIVSAKIRYGREIVEFKCIKCMGGNSNADQSGYENRSVEKAKEALVRRFREKHSPKVEDNHSSEIIGQSGIESVQ